MLSIVLILSATRHRIAICCLDEIARLHYDMPPVTALLDRYGERQALH